MSLPLYDPATSLSGDVLKLGIDLWSLALEAQAVVAMRLLGMSGLWKVSPDEGSLMVYEKQVGFAAATTAAVTAASLGRRPDQVVSSAVQPLRERTAANVDRLQKAGLKVPFVFDASA